MTFEFQKQWFITWSTQFELDSVWLLLKLFSYQPMNLICTLITALEMFFMVNEILLM